VLERLPDIDELTCLRSLLRTRVSEVLPMDDALRVIDRCDAAVDRLIADRTSRDIAALQSVAFLDPLTGVGNRRALERDLSRELARAIRHDRKVAVAAIDLDGLKRINDDHGHAAGDQALRSLARVLSETVRTGDGVYRVGGDEFVVVLPETDGEIVAPLLGRCLTAAPRFSYGVATAPEDGTKASQLLDVADARLIEDRRTVRGKVPAAAGRRGRGTTGTTTLDEQGDDIVIDIGSSGSAGRGVFEEIVIVSRERTLDIEVVLRIDRATVRGRAGGSSVAAAAPQVAAGAVVDALISVDPDLAGAHIDGAEIIRVGSLSVAVVTVLLPSGGGDDRYTGAALVRDRGPLEASARAMLDALNRRVARATGVTV
jgi:diguanylate cyclase (GGDEF)-like protein